MKLWNWLFGRKKEEAKTRKKKILLSTLIPISLIVAAVSVFLSYSCSSRERIHGIVINEDTINKKELYKVPVGKEVWTNEEEWGKMSFGHDLIDVKAFSKDHDNVTEFTVDGVINYGFLVDFDMDFHLYGINNALMQWSGSGNGGSVIVGNTIQPPNTISYSKNMYIDSTMSFNMANDMGEIAGVYIASIASGSTQTINGTFNISSAGNAYGVYFFSSAVGSVQTINGTFNISSQRAAAHGVRLGIAALGSITINGMFVISSFNNNYDSGNNYASGVYCQSSTVESNVIIRGTFTILSGGTSVGVVIISSDASSSNVVIDGVFSIYSYGDSSKSIGVYLINQSGDILIPSLIINGMFILYSELDSISVNIGSPNITINDNIISAQFFSNKADGSIIFQHGSWTYKWNDLDVNATESGNDSIADDTPLTLQDISDNEDDPHFTIKIIANAMSRNKEIFNTAYKNALQNYVKQKYCPTTAKPWLESIINKIPL